MFHINVNLKMDYPFLYLKDSSTDCLADPTETINESVFYDKNQISFFLNPWYEKLNHVYLSIDNDNTEVPERLIYFGEFTIETPSAFLVLQDEDITDQSQNNIYLKLPTSRKTFIKIFLEDSKNISIIALKIKTGLND